MTKRKYIKPPEARDSDWRKGPPPEPGWWPTTTYTTTNTDMLRWWDGEWSDYARSAYTSREAAEYAEIRDDRQHLIRWTDRWWEGK